MSKAQNSAVTFLNSGSSNFPKFRKHKLTDLLPRPHTALAGGRQSAQHHDLSESASQ